MKERPILFNGDMVRALLAGTKTQTRRVVKPQPVWNADLVPNGWEWRVPIEKGPLYKWPVASDFSIELARRCPYGQPGDRLWVRETWARDDEDGTMLFRADDNEATRTWEHERIVSGLPRYRWRPSIHMPRWASRILLEIVSVHVERLQEISEEDAKGEGLYQDQAGRWTTYSATEQHREHLNPVEAYRELWESINGDGSWDANPWVWVVEFKRVEN